MVATVLFLADGSASGFLLDDVAYIDGVGACRSYAVGAVMSVSERVGWSGDVVVADRVKSKLFHPSPNTEMADVQ